MKRVKWGKGESRGVVGDYPPKTGRMLLPDDPVKPEMQVVARYEGLDVYLEITEETAPGVFQALVLYFEPVSASKPKDLAEADEVIIHREHICWLFD